MLSIRNLSKTYSGNVRALDGVDLDIPIGMFGLLGPNGAGKSSLMRTIASLQKPDAGTISLGGVNLLDDPDATRRIIGYLPQDFGVYPKVSAARLLDHIAALKGIPKSIRKDVTEDLLHRVNLWQVRQQALGTYSGGMRQRFGVAQALLGSPKIVIVDEPTAGLDPEERHRLLDLLVDVARSTRVVMSTHNVQDVAELCPLMAIVSKGRVIYSGTTTGAMDAIKDRVWRKLYDRGHGEHMPPAQSILSTRLVTGCTEVHITADQKPEGYGAVEPDLSDAYFFHLKHGEQATGAAKEHGASAHTHVQ